jgi:hypothetical protein
VRIEDLYDAAQGCGFLTAVQAGGQTVWCAFRAPDDDALSGLVQSTDYAIDYPTSRLRLSAGDAVEIGGARYTVREVKALRDGSEMRAMLSKA